MRPLLQFSLFVAIALATVACGSAAAPASPQAPTKAVGATPSPAAPTPAPATATRTPAGATPTAAPTASVPTATRPAGDTPPATTAHAATTIDQEMAVQTLLDYFSAINDRDYGRAYGYWAGGGSASGQTLAQFSSGYTDTVLVTVLLGAVTSQAAGGAPRVVVPVTTASVVNLPDHSQRVERYQGSYTLQPAGSSGSGGWVIGSANVSAVSSGSQPPAEVADPVSLLRAYFDAINQRQFAHAYSLWEQLGQASQQSFARFEQGFATTRQVKVDIGAPQYGGAAGNVYADLPVTIVATQSDGSTRSYSGTYTAHRANVPPFEQLGWRIAGAKVAASSGS